VTERTLEFESLLRQALSPVEPPAGLEARLEQTLDSMLEAAADELESWELRAMRDPRNWVRPAAAVVVGTAAAAGLVVVRTQRRRHKRRANASTALELAGDTLRDAAQEARKLMHEATHRR
jgi:hypothetical protein